MERILKNLRAIQRFGSSEDVQCHLFRKGRKRTTKKSHKWIGRTKIRMLYIEMALLFQNPFSVGSSGTANASLNSQILTIEVSIRFRPTQYQSKIGAMCKVVEFCYGCGYPHSYILVEECYAGFFPSGILCGQQNTEIIGSVTVLEHPYCIDYCFGMMKLEMEINFVLRSCQLMDDARTVGWTEADIRGSHQDLRDEFERELDELMEICNMPKNTPKAERKPVPKSTLDATGGPPSDPESSPEGVTLESSTAVSRSSSGSRPSYEPYTERKGVETQLENERRDEAPPDIEQSQPCRGLLNSCGKDKCGGHQGRNERPRMRSPCYNHNCHGYHSHNECPFEKECSGCHSSKHFWSQCPYICTTCGHNRHKAEYCSDFRTNLDGTSVKKMSHHSITPRTSMLRGGLTQSWRSS